MVVRVQVPPPPIINYHYLILAIGGNNLKMCICINCLHVNKCSTYKNIQQQHGQDACNNHAIFHPIDPIIHVNLYQNSITIETDWDITECLSFIDKPGNWIN